MYNLEFKIRNCDDKEITLHYINPSDYVSLVDHGNDEDSMDLPMLDDEVLEMTYYEKCIDLKQNNINIVLDIYNFCVSRIN